MALQQLALLEGFDLAGADEAEFVHVVIECAKLAFADRDAFYGDVDVPLETLLSREYNDDAARSSATPRRRRTSPGLGPPAIARRGGANSRVPGEPTRGDTCHVDVADRFGNMISATPSGGWL